MIFPELQTAIATRLETMQDEETGMQALVITTESKGSVDEKIQERIRAASSGLVVATPSFRAGEHTNWVEVDVAIVHTENVTVSAGETGSRASATEVAEFLYAYLQAWQPSVEGWSPLQFQQHETRDADPDSGILLHVTLFTTQAHTTQTTT